MSEVTRILSQLDAGDPQSAAQLLPLVYDELRKLAAAKMAHEKPGQTVQATALVHDAYIRLVGGAKRSEAGDQQSESDDSTSAPRSPASECWHSRGHFFAAAAEAMRRILVENARRKARQKRGGDRERVPIDMELIADESSAEDLLAVSDALAQLEVEDPETAQVVKLRYFAGLTTEQAAEALQISTRTANRHWAYAKAWLFQRLS